MQALEERIRNDLFAGRKRSSGENLADRRVSSQASNHGPRIAIPEEEPLPQAPGGEVTPEAETLGLRTLAGQHKSFILALLRGKKLSKESAMLIINEFKTFTEKIDSECFYCVFSYLAFQKALESEESTAPEVATNALLRLFKNYPFRKMATNSTS